VDEGTGNVLDVLQKRARVNTVFPAVFTYSRGIAGRHFRARAYLSWVADCMGAGGEPSAPIR
jgi:hypothetical protein